MFFRLVFLFLWGICTTLPQLYAQGKLMLVGGNAETQGGWSDLPYQWAISQSANQRIAIISTKEENDWLPEYLFSLGAKKVQHFQINSAIRANSDWMYDSLMNYDILLLKGENQWEQFALFQGSMVQRAIIDTYQSAGVICASAASIGILSDVAFTAEKGGIYSDEALRNLNSEYVRLDRGLTKFYEGYIFDSHFVEKGRLGRMLGFMGHWWLSRQENLVGIGVDDKTAFCVDSLGIGTVYGTGAVSLLLNDLDGSEFAESGRKPVIDSIRLIQLVEQDSFDLISWEAQSRGTFLAPPKTEEHADCTILMSGSDPLSENIEFLDAFAQEGEASDPIMIVTGPDSGTSEAVQAMLLSRGIEDISILPTSQNHLFNSVLEDQLESAKKFLFVGNQIDSLLAFLETPNGNGQLLARRIKEPGIIHGFVGKESRLAGKRFLDNYQEVWASYDGILETKPGLGLLQTSIVMPNTYLDPDFYENTLSGIPYSMVKDSLAYGIWLGPHSYARYFTENERIFLQSFGELPSMLLHNSGTNCHTSASYGGTARNIVGFEQMMLSLIDSSALPIGQVKTFARVEVPKIRGDWLAVYPNPVKDHLNIFLYGRQTGTFDFQLIDGQGKMHLNHTQVINSDTQTIRIPIPNLPLGVYVLQVRQQDEGIIHKVQVIH